MSKPKIESPKKKVAKKKAPKKKAKEKSVTEKMKVNKFGTRSFEPLRKTYTMSWANEGGGWFGTIHDDSSAGHCVCIIVEPSGGIYGGWRWSFRWRGFSGGDGYIHVRAPEESNRTPHLQVGSQIASGHDRDPDQAKKAAEICLFALLEELCRQQKIVWDGLPGEVVDSDCM